ncbi:MAG: PhoH family protein, partial [Xenophilus sp.]
MPLPPAPTRRAALLSPDAIDAPARSTPKGARRNAAERHAEEGATRGYRPLELFDDRREGGGAAPATRAPAPEPARPGGPEAPPAL